MKRRVIVLFCAIIAISSLAQEKRITGLNDDTKSILWVIDGVVLDTLTQTTNDVIITDSIATWMSRYIPLIKPNDIEQVNVYNSLDVLPTACRGGNNIIIVIRTREDSYMRDLELNGVYTSRKKKLALGYFASKTGLERLIEKKWRIKHIKSINIHPEGKLCFDKKGKPHQVRLSIETE